jgi:exosortase/archaeosortase family protein
MLSSHEAVGRVAKIVWIASSFVLIVLTAHALSIHTMASELSPAEIILIELAWVPILLLSSQNCRRALIVVFLTYSGYFLPRLLELLPWSILKLFFLPDYHFNNLLFETLNINARMLMFPGGAYIIAEGTGPVGYLIGCSSLREIPMLLALVIAVPTSVKKKLLASAIVPLLVFPTNALRIALILVAAKEFRWDVGFSHIVLSPILTLIFVSVIMMIQDIIVDRRLLEYIEKAFLCLLQPLVPRLHQAQGISNTEA